eukprot:m.210608 g.210608  ORF g.210608 m.210608 type:complete len:820 (+) comp15824_c0_seq3:338-2797(+)
MGKKKKKGKTSASGQDHNEPNFHTSSTTEWVSGETRKFVALSLSNEETKSRGSQQTSPTKARQLASARKLKQHDAVGICQQYFLHSHMHLGQLLRVTYNATNTSPSRDGGDTATDTKESNTRACICVAWPLPTFPMNSVLMHDEIFNNLQIESGDQVKIERLDNDIVAYPAETVNLELQDIQLLSLVERMNTSEPYKSYVKGILLGRRFQASQNFSATYEGNLLQFLIRPLSDVHVTDDDFTLYEVQKETILEFTRPSSLNEPLEEIMEEKAKGYKYIGGLSKEIEIIRDMLELPKHTELLSQYGLTPPSGLLLVGPPGTGKTLLATTAAREAGAYTICINGPEVLSKFYGETERRLRDIFAKARKNAPALIFIDEIDSLCPARDQTPNELEKRIVATLLSLMDGVSTGSLDGLNRANKHVLVIGATNRPNALDPAVRRPGRFDRELEIGIPSATGRFEILKAILQDVPNGISDEDIRAIAGITHGYVGADLNAVCMEAAVSAVRHVNDSSNSDEESQIRLSLDDLRAGLKEVRPSAMREIVLDVPQVRWGDIGGQENVKDKLKEAVDWPLLHPEAFKRMGIRPPRGVLLYGPPGCSKTMMAKALATESSLNFIAVKGPELFSKWVGESEKAVQSVFKKARAASPAIVFFDEIDALAVRRGSDDNKGSGVKERVLAQLLAEMDGVEELKNVIVLAATNRPDLVDPALLRPGRIDRIIYIGLPDLPSRKRIFEIQFEKMAFEKTLDPQLFAERTEGYSGADIVAVCREAGMIAVSEDPQNASEIRASHLDKALKSVTASTPQELLEFYNKYQEEQRKSKK